jgi:uncharacterized protein (TIGR02678 family)
VSRELSDALAQRRAAGLQRAARALLRRPLLRAVGPGSDDFPLVREHAPALRDWFARNTGWRLTVDSERARLVKTSTVHLATHPARDARSRAPFTRRRYVLVCLALAALERADAQVTLGRLGEQVLLAAADPALAAAGIRFTLERADQRSDLVAAVRLLLDLGVLTRVAGDEEAFVRDSGDVLYDVDRRALATLLAAPRGPSTVDAGEFEQRLTALTAVSPAAGAELRNQQVRHRLTRRLLDDPVVHLDQLDDEERAYLTGQRHALTSRITELTGLVAEVRAEGVAMVDPQDDLTDVRMPETGTEGHATLLLAEHLSAAPGPVQLADLQGHLARQAREHRSYWRKDAGLPGAEVLLTEQALTRLEALGLIRRDGDSVEPRPALSRYAVGEPTVQEARS